MHSDNEFEQILKSYSCRQCGKVVEIPIRADAEQYGFPVHGNRFCSYHCMRQYCSEFGRQMLTEDTDKHRERRVTDDALRRLACFIRLRDGGMLRRDAAKAAGYPSEFAAKKARSMFEKTDVFTRFLANESENSD